MLNLANRRFSQPTVRVKPNGNHYLAGSLAALVVMTPDGPYELTTNRRATMSSGADQYSYCAHNAGTATLNGPFANLAKGIASTWWQFPAALTEADRLVATAFTVLAIGTRIDAPGNATGNVIGSSDPAASTCGWGLNVDDNAFAGTGRIVMQMRDGAGLVTINNGTNNVLTSDPQNKLHFFGAAADGTNFHFYSAGSAGFQKQAVAQTKLCDTTSLSLRRLLIGKRVDSISDTGACALAIVITGRVLSVQEYKTLWDNPWQIVSPDPKKLYFNTAAAGGAFKAAWASQRSRVIGAGALA